MDFQIKPELNKEEKTVLQAGTLLMAHTWKWKVTGAGGQEGYKGTQVVKAAAQVWRVTQGLLPSRSC